jgi:hypothetical protein
MSKAMTGRLPWNTGKKLSKETKLKISLKAKGRPSSRKGAVLTEEQRKKLSLLKKGKPCFQSKVIKNTSTNEIVANSAVELYEIADCKGRSLVTIHSYLNGHAKKPEWFTFEYVKTSLC